MYEYAKIYYEYHGNLEVPAKFKTNNGSEYCEDGQIPLGRWIANQRTNTSPESKRGQSLLKIGMRFSNKNNTLSWEEMYNYAKIYYEYHGDLEVPARFKTNNGFEYCKDGEISLGTWVSSQRNFYKMKVI